jgi:hypothetical protein
MEYVMTFFQNCERSDMLSFVHLNLNNRLADSSKRKLANISIISGTLDGMTSFS